MESAEGTDEVTLEQRRAIRDYRIMCRCPAIEGQPSSERHVPGCVWVTAVYTIYGRERANEVRKA